MILTLKIVDLWYFFLFKTHLFKNYCLIDNNKLAKV
jgi:hypothetical protein